MLEMARGRRIVNVASIPQRSPFRYPGGKTWLVPYIRLWLHSQPQPVEELIEPFAGGAIVGLTAVFEGLARKAILIEIDPDVAAVWRTILKGRGRWLAEKIARFKVTPESVRKTLSSPAHTIQERALATILRNRVQRGGILAPGAGLMKYGENGKGITSRWYPATLRKRILDIIAIRHRLNFLQGDGLEYLQQKASRKDAVYFIDPPYTVAGRRLYRYSQIDHRTLFGIAMLLAGDFLMSYDNTAEIRRLAAEFGFDTHTVPMKSTHHAKKSELLVGRNLDWARSQAIPQLVFPEFFPQKLRDSRDGLL